MNIKRAIIGGIFGTAVGCTNAIGRLALAAFAPITYPTTSAIASSSTAAVLLCKAIKDGKISLSDKKQVFTIGAIAGSTFATGAFFGLLSVPLAPLELVLAPASIPMMAGAGVYLSQKI